MIKGILVVIYRTVELLMAILAIVFVIGICVTVIYKMPIVVLLITVAFILFIRDGHVKIE